MAAIGAVLGVIGTVVSAAGTMAAAKQAERDAEFMAKQDEQNAALERAKAQRKQDQIHLERDRLISRNRALAASSGGGALDESVLDLSSDIHEESYLQSGLVRGDAENVALGLRDRAAARVASAKANTQGAKLSAFGTILGGFSNMFGRFGGGGSRFGSANLRYG